MVGDESVDLAEKESVGGAEEFDSCDANRGGCDIVFIVSGGGICLLIAESGGDEKSDIVTRIHLHDLASGDREVVFV